MPVSSKYWLESAFLGVLFEFRLDLFCTICTDLDLAGLHGFRDLTDKINVKQAIFQMGVADLDMVGQLEPALEVAGSDAAEQNFGIGLLVLLLIAFDKKRVFLGFNIQVFFAETGYGHGNTIGVFAGPFDIVGRIGWGALFGLAHGIEQAEQAIKTYRGTVERTKIYVSHFLHILIFERFEFENPANPLNAADLAGFAAPFGDRTQKMGIGT